MYGFILLFTDVIGTSNDKTPIGSSGSNGVEPSPNSSYSKPEDELEKLTHRSCSSLGVVSFQNTCNYTGLYYIICISERCRYNCKIHARSGLSH